MKTLKKKVWLVFGTRPEAIKMCPLVNELKKSNQLEVSVCVTAQHREMLDQVLSLFKITPEFDLDIMTPNQTLSSLTAKIMMEMDTLLSEYKPDIILVHGDTTTTLAVSLAAYYQQIKVGHIEAGLRTNDMYSPWPEEGNRQLTTVLANWHFAPTQKAFLNLRGEGVNESIIEVTGNTVIDALLSVCNTIKDDPSYQNLMENHYSFLKQYERMILVTGHRRENQGGGFEHICNALLVLAEKYPETVIVYPVHLNPNVKGPVEKLLSGVKNIKLIRPLEYKAFIYFLKASYIVLTDSGGIQEEAPSLGKPVLVMRNTTERPEALEAGTVKLVGSDEKIIIDEISKLLDNKEAYKEMSYASNPYGDGLSCQRIRKALEEKFLT